MPDIKTALSTALENGKRQALNATLDAWEQDEKETQLEKPVITGKKNLFEITNNVTRATFEYVRDNPDKTSTQVSEALAQYNKSSILSLIAQFIMQQQMVKDSYGRLRTTGAAYKPLVSRSKWQKMNGIVVAKRKPEPKRIYVKRKYVKRNDNAQAAGIGALPVQEKKQEITSILISRNWTAQGVVDKLTVVQARQLYDVLKNIFGG